MRLFLCVLTIALCFGIGPAAAEESEMASGINTFGMDLYRQVAVQPGNLFFSPASMSSAFGMAYAGARGKTAQQMAAVLHFDPSPQKVGAQTAKLLNAWNAPGEDRGFQ